MRALASSAAALLASQGMLGAVGQRLDVNSARRFIDPVDGESYVVRINAEGKPVRIKANATALLQYDEWKDIDRTVIEVATQRMVAIGDLRERGLTHNLGGIGVSVSLWDRQSDMTEAKVSMDAKARGDKDTIAYATQTVPVPIIHKEFELSLRRLEASRRQGGALDVTQAQISARLVAEKMEYILFNGDSIKVEGAAIYGYLTHPDRNTVDMGATWDTLIGSNGENSVILEDVQAMQQASRNDRHFGPWVLYIPSAYEAKLDEDYRGSQSSDSRTVRERLMALKGLLDIKVADFMAANQVVLVSLEPDVVDLAIGQDVTTVQWSTNGGMSEEFKVMMVAVPRIKSDFDGRSGIVHLRPVS